MASVVSIQIRIDDSNVSETLGRIEKALTEVGVQGDASVRKIGPALQEVHGHTTTALDGVRLLSQEFGLRLPRALEAMLSRMPAVTSAIGSMVSGLAGIAFAEVFVRGAEAIYDAEQKYVSINAAAEKFYETLKKTTELDFVNTRTLETTGRRMDEAQRGVVAGPNAASALQHAGLLSLIQGNFATGVGFMAGAHSAAESGAEDMSHVIELGKRQLDQQHEEALRQIEVNHALDDTLSKRQQIAAALTKEKEINKENRKYDHDVEGYYGNPVTAASGASEEAAKDAIAAAQARVKLQQLGGEDALLQVKALSAERMRGLEGEAAYIQKEKNAEAEVTQELTNQRNEEQIGLRLKEMRAQFADEELKRVRDLTTETQRMNRETASAGLTGSARILADGSAATQGVNDRQASFSGGAALSPEAQKQFDQQRLDVATETNRKLNELEQQFTDHARQLSQQRADDALGAYGKIDAAAERQQDDLTKLYNEDIAANGMSDAKKLEADRQYAAASAAIASDAAAKKAEIASRNRAEDEQYDREAMQAEARVREQGVNGWVASYKDGIAAIEAQEQQRIQKLQEDAQREELTWQEVANRRADIEAQAAAEVAEQNQQLQHTIAGQLQEAFTNPMKYIQQKGEQMMFEMIASWIMQLHLFQRVFSSTINGAHPGVIGGAAGVGVGSGGAGGSAAAGGGIWGTLLQRAGMGTGGVIPAGTSLPASYNGTYASPSATYPSGGGGGTAAGGYGGGYSSPYTGTGISPAHGPSASQDASSILNDANSIYKQYGLTQQQTGAATPTVSTSSTTTTAPFADNGEDGGFAGYMTGDADPMMPAAAGSVDAAADAQVQAANAAVNAGGAGASGMSQILGAAGAGMTAYTGTEGVLNAFHQAGLKGALDGTMSGLAAGAAAGSFLGPVGTLIGGAIGAVAGIGTNLVGQFMDEPNKFAARTYYKKTVEPELEGMLKQWGNGGGDYLSAVSDANKDAGDGYIYMQTHFGKEAADWVNDNYMKKELEVVTSRIEQMARGGSQYAGRTAAEFHTGGIIGGFGDLSTTSTEGYIHAMVGEGIVNAPATQVHGAAIGMMNSGATAADMAGHYLAASSGGRAGSGGGTVNHHHWNVSAIDAKSFGKSLDGGLMREINLAANRYAGRYAGDGIG